jgi:hypothetical protein
MSSFRFGKGVSRFTSVTTLVVVVPTISVNKSDSRVLRRRDGILRTDRPIPGRYLVVLRRRDDPALSAMAAEGVGRGRVHRIYRHTM